ncbi:MAG: hypothetical protein LBH43_15945 [Treponema sp.]|jgi:hypothetical protein|nr:hypothetical protein [Treponema sp.]
MIIFCLLWMPLFYLFWRSIGEKAAGSGGVWAMLLGSITALIQFFLGGLVEPGGFGFSRWLSACVDIIALPALLPILVYLIFIILRVVSGPLDFANFALLWLIPCAAIRSLAWNASRDPTLLVLAPVLWTSIAIGISFMIECIMNNGRFYVVIPCVLVIIAIPLGAASSWWAVYSQNLNIGFALLFAAMIPFIVSVIVSLVKRRA